MHLPMSSSRLARCSYLTIDISMFDVRRCADSRTFLPSVQASNTLKNMYAEWSMPTMIGCSSSAAPAAADVAVVGAGAGFVAAAAAAAAAAAGVAAVAAATATAAASIAAPTKSHYNIMVSMAISLAPAVRMLLRHAQI